MRQQKIADADTDDFTGNKLTKSEKKGLDKSVSPSNAFNLMRFCSAKKCATNHKKNSRSAIA